MPAVPDCCCCIRICDTTVCLDRWHPPKYDLPPIQILPNGDSLARFSTLIYIKESSQASSIGEDLDGCQQLVFSSLLPLYGHVSQLDV